jgi:HlyD family secretion protein
MARILKYLLGLGFLGALTAGAYAWLGTRVPAGGGIELVPVTRGTIVEKAVAIGQIEPRVRFRVKSKISGIVKRCAVEVGERVRPGDPLFEIVPDPTPLELVEADRRVAAARSAFQRAETDHERASELARQGIVRPRAFS